MCFLTYKKHAAQPRNTHVDTAELYLPIWLLLAGRYFLDHLWDLSIVRNKNGLRVGVRDAGMVPFHLLDVAHLL